MSTTLGDRLSLERHRRFVGRTSERALFRSILEADDEPIQVIIVYGPGGVGKSALLREFAYLCDEARIPFHYLDARNTEPASEPFLTSLKAAMGLDVVGPVEALAESGRRTVILIDTFELLAPLEGWLRDRFLPQLPANAIVVFAGRNHPETGWRSDPGWQAVIRTIPLRNLSPDESRTYLTNRQVPTDQAEPVLSFTRGHPLALSLVADSYAQRSSLQFQPTADPDILKSLLEQFVQKVPGPAHRAALEACALVRLTTETLLADMLKLPDAHELFGWLRNLSFIESGRQGIFPHDTAREALVADLRWRNPDWYRELHKRARTFYANHLTSSSGSDQQRILIDYIFLHRESPIVRPVFDWSAGGGILIDTARSDDYPALLAMVERHEGAESARLAAYWFKRQPRGALVVRDGDSTPIGLLDLVSLHEATDEDLAFDRAAMAAKRYLDTSSSLRPGERATLFRFWMARDTYQMVSPVQSLIFVNMVRHYLTTPGLAFTFIPCAAPDFWAPIFAYADLDRLPAADFEVGSHQYGVYGHDWRVVPPMTWLTLLADREVEADTPELSRPAGREPLIVLSQQDFASAVRDALRQFARPATLNANPLLRSRLVIDRSGDVTTDSERIGVLRELILEAARSLQVSPRQIKLYRALHHTYFSPAATQEQAAELMDLPFSTYRRHLAAGIAAVVDLLWQWELHGYSSSLP